MNDGASLERLAGRGKDKKWDWGTGKLSGFYQFKGKKGSGVLGLIMVSGGWLTFLKYGSQPVICRKVFCVTYAAFSIHFSR